MSGHWNEKSAFEIDIRDNRTITVSLATLPSRPTVVVLPMSYPLGQD